MVFLIFWLIFASPMLRELSQRAIAATQKKTAFEAEMLSDIDASSRQIKLGD